MTEDDADENERLEAEALAAALEGEAPNASSRGAGQAPADALETAALLRHGGASGALSDARAEAVLRRVRAEAPRTIERRRPRGAVRRLPWAAGLAAAAAGVLIWFAGRSVEQPRSAEVAAPSDGTHAANARALPVPRAALLSSQAELARGDDAAAGARFEQEMRDYRNAFLHALQRAYPAPLSRLEPERAARSRR
jgi:hypothetical protein